MATIYELLSLSEEARADPATAMALMPRFREFAEKEQQQLIENFRPLRTQVLRDGIERIIVSLDAWRCSRDFSKDGAKRLQALLQEIDYSAILKWYQYDHDGSRKLGFLMSMGLCIQAVFSLGMTPACQALAGRLVRAYYTVSGNNVLDKWIAARLNRCTQVWIRCARVAWKERPLEIGDSLMRCFRQAHTWPASLTQGQSQGWVHLHMPLEETHPLFAAFCACLEAYLPDLLYVCRIESVEHCVQWSFFLIELLQPKQTDYNGPVFELDADAKIARLKPSDVAPIVIEDPILQVAPQNLEPVMPIHRPTAPPRAPAGLTLPSITINLAPAGVNHIPAAPPLPPAAPSFIPVKLNLVPAAPKHVLGEKLTAAVDTSAVENFKLLAERLNDAPDPSLKSPPIKVPGVADSLGLPVKLTSMPAAPQKGAPWFFAEEQTTKKKRVTLPTESRERRKIDWMNKGFLLALITAGIRAEDGAWEKQWRDFTTTYDMAPAPPSASTPRNLLQEFVEQNLYHARQQKWADFLLFQDAGETDVPWDRVEDTIVTNDISAATSSSALPRGADPPVDSFSAPVSPPSHDGFPQHSDSVPSTPLVASKRTRDDDGASTSSASTRKRRRKKDKREKKEERDREKKEERDREKKEERDREKKEETERERERKDEREREKKEERDRERKEERGREKNRKEERDAEKEREKKEKKKRRLNMIGFSDAEESDGEIDGLGQGVEPALYHKTQMCILRMNCPRKKGCIFAHVESELRAVGEAKRMYDLRMRRNGMDPASVKIAKLKEMKENPLFKTSTCPYVGPGRQCHFGNHCFYAHSLSELRPPPSNAAGTAAIPAPMPAAFPPQAPPMAHPGMMQQMPVMAQQMMNQQMMMNSMSMMNPGQMMMMAMMQQQQQQRYGVPAGMAPQTVAQNGVQDELKSQRRKKKTIRDDDL
eukprot:GEMP01012044.1.p1 GENE.GEMP01012044.1~~GEMP01012044.1.p1  ORF type:complete len:943 (-),score=243.96 GEMP01012044.1:355-3159(-)